MSFLVQVMVNVAEPRGGGPGDRTFRAACKVYEHRLERLHDPIIAAPPIRRTSTKKLEVPTRDAATNGAATNGKTVDDPEAPLKAPGKNKGARVP
jgi:hypothetical protein